MYNHAKTLVNFANGVSVGMLEKLCDSADKVKPFAVTEGFVLSYFRTNTRAREVLFSIEVIRNAAVTAQVKESFQRSVDVGL